MFGRCFRRPFGQDYCTITDNWLLEHWVKQLDWFEKAKEAPSFRAVYHALRSLLVREWDGYDATGKMEKVGLLEGKPHLLKYHKGKEVFNAKQLDDDLERLDAWADQGFLKSLSASEPVLTDLRPINLPGVQLSSANHPQKDKSPEKKPASECEIDMSAVCDGQWVQNCEKWAKCGLPCHDSIFQVVSHLARWFYFIEFWNDPEDLRLERIVEILTEFVVTKHNGFVSRLNAGHERDVVKQVGRIVSCAVIKVDDLGKWWFARVRHKRQSGQYRRVIYLEPVIGMSHRGGKAVQDNESLSSSLGLICCSDLGIGNGQKESCIEPHEDQDPSLPPIEVNNGLSDSEDINKATDRRMEAEQWGSNQTTPFCLMN